MEDLKTTRTQKYIQKINILREYLNQLEKNAFCFDPLRALKIGMLDNALKLMRFEKKWNCSKKRDGEY